MMEEKFTKDYVLNLYGQRVVRDFTWRVSDCEELVGFLTGDDEGWFRRIQNISSIGGFESESSN